MDGERKFKIDAFPDSAFRYVDRDAIVCVDVICSSTTVVTAAAQGRRTFPAADTEAALVLASRLEEPLLAGELDGVQPPGFEMGNSPAALARRTDIKRPLVLAAPGTSLIVNAGAGKAAYVACYRNLSATAAYLASHYERIVILGAGVGRDFRCEDQMACAMIGRVLMARGFEPEDVSTSDMVSRWSRAEAAMTNFGKSAVDLRRFGHHEDLDFVVSHFDDVQVVCRLYQGEVLSLDVSVSAAPDTVERPAIEQWWGQEWGIVVPFSPRPASLPEKPAGGERGRR